MLSLIMLIPFLTLPKTACKKFPDILKPNYTSVILLSQALKTDHKKFHGGKKSVGRFDYHDLRQVTEVSAANLSQLDQLVANVVP